MLRLWRPQTVRRAIDQARKIKPDVIILDITMPGMTGIEAARQLKRELPQIPILILSMHDLYAVAGQLSRIGVQGFISKAEVAQNLPDAINAVVSGGTFFRTATPQ